ncbi:MAG: response regulator [Alphaproteobacteria bacterium]|nr:response regulator [Alphaproteobacteria bacterium]
MGNGRRVMVIDDDSFVADFVSIILGKKLYSTVACYTFEKALEQMERSTFDLVVTDIFMPGMGGIEGIQKLKSKHPDTIVIAMSAGWKNLEPEDAVEAAKKIGADAGLVKPVSTAKLNEVLSSLYDD